MRTSAWNAFATYLGYAVLILTGHIRDWFGRLTGSGRYFGRQNKAVEPGYPPLVSDFESFFTRRLYHRIRDCWNRPIEGAASSGALKVVERSSKDSNFTVKVHDTTKTCINLGSYNYLGFADDWTETCRDQVMESLDTYGPALCASAHAGGYAAVTKELEDYVAEFTGKEAAMVFNMGFGTNSTGIPALAGKGCLMISDALNHSSIVAGVRNSGATVRVYEHGNYANLESMVRDAIVQGQPRTHRPWRKVIIVIEGVYSMEGEIVDLPAVVRVAKKYKCYIYLDEAHSIGAVGRNGGGVCEYHNVPTSDIDIMMGTFTKSYGAMGGYIAASKEVVDFLRTNSAGSMTGTAISPVVAAQVLRAFRVITGDDGTDAGRRKLDALRENSNYFRKALINMGLDVLGSWDSPVVPVMLYQAPKIAAFSRICLDHGLAVVVVGYPATPLLEGRVRFCLSAGHTRKDLDRALEVIAKVADELVIRYRA